MPKTRDAFAMREYIDNFFEIAGESNSHNFLFHFDVWTKEDYLSRIEMADSQIKKMHLLYKLVNRHLPRLNRFLASTAVKLAQNTNDKKLQSAILRGTHLLEEYKQLETLFSTGLESWRENKSGILKEIKKLSQNTFSKRLQTARKKAGYTGTETAEYLNISQKSYSQYEVGRATPPLSTIWILAQRFNVSADWLIGLKD